MSDHVDIEFQVCYSNFLTIIYDTKEEVQRAYEMMKEGSKTIYKMEATAYSSCRVVFVDRFGIRWGIMTEQTQKLDKKEDILTCNASEVLEAGHGICFAKSHLLAAILQCKGIPAGFCYQKLILDDETAPILVYHGLNGVYIKELKKWIRLDARGNREDVDAQFSIEQEQLAFPVRSEMGEMDSFTVYPKPDVIIVEALRESKTRTALWNHLPTELGYLKMQE